MRWVRSIVCALALGLGVAGFAAASAEDDTKAPPPAAASPAAPATPAPTPATPSPDTEAQRNGKLWVCCDDGRSRWTATNEVCKQRGGQLLPSRFCERPKYVCCKQGRAEWWMPDAYACHRDGGVVADASYCR